MGIQTSAVEFLIFVRKRGVEFGHTLTLGKQNLFVSPIRLRRLLQRYRLWREHISINEFYDSMCQSPYYVDPLLKFLGATKVSSIDISPFEGADVIHDLNIPVSNHFHKKYDLIIDGGLLEHVFNFPAAIKNCMQMTKVGGHLCIFTVANNYFGHGFYQFSPELFYRVLSPENGFKIDKMIATTNDIGCSRFLGVNYHPEYIGKWFEVYDPNEIKQRVLLVNDKPISLLILATHTHDLPIFSEMPKQSDYVVQWKKTAHDHDINTGSIPKSFIRDNVVYAWLKRKLTPAQTSHLLLHMLPKIIRFINPGNYNSWIKNQSLNNRDFYFKFDKR